MTYQDAVRRAERKRIWRNDHLEETHERGNSYTQKYRENNKEKCHARYEVRKALRKGILKRKPCEICGEINVEAHHEDYSNPLDVKWLCGECHDHVHAGRITFLFV